MGCDRWDKVWLIEIGNGEVLLFLVLFLVFVFFVGEVGDVWWSLRWWGEVDFFVGEVLERGWWVNGGGI